MATSYRTDDNPFPPGFDPWGVGANGGPGYVGPNPTPPTPVSRGYQAGRPKDRQSRGGSFGVGKPSGKVGGSNALSLEDILAMMGGSGGTGGGGGNGAAIAAALADADAREKKARDRYTTNTADVTTMYGQLSSAISGYRPTIEQDYANQIASTNDRAAQQSGLLSGELAAQDQRRDVGAADLGISSEQLAGGPELESEAVLNAALGQIGNTATNWTGFLNSERGTTLDRNQNSATAATATGAQTNDQLKMALEDYLQQLDSERAQIKASGSSGGGGGRGGGGGSSAQNSVLSYLAKAMIDQQMAGPSEFEQKLGALGKLGLNPGSIGESLYNVGLGDRGNATAEDYWTQLIAKSLFD